MWPIVTDGVAWSVGLSALLSVTIVSHAKTDEPIEMSFALWTGVGPRNHVLDGGPDPPWEEVILTREGAAHCKVQEIPSVCGGDAAFGQTTVTSCCPCCCFK